MWYVYVLQSYSHKFLYVGSTNNIQRRVVEHNIGKTQSTSPYKPYKLALCIALPHEKQARSLEEYFKTGSGKTILKKRILQDEDLAKHEVLSEA